jgi:putative endonuclease
MASVYILYSSSLNRYYIGSCKDLLSRIDDHFVKYFPDAYTSKGNDWILFFKIDNSQARKIELHIKRMKSQTYVRNLKEYPELVVKIIRKFA